MLLLADRGLVGAERWRAAQATGEALVWRVQTGRFSPALPVEQPLADGSWLSRLALLARAAPPIVVRVLDYSIDDQRPPNHPDRSWPAGHLPAGDLHPGPRPGSSGRAGRPLPPTLGDRNHLDELKIHQRGPGMVLRSKTPNGVRQEAWSHLLVHYALRALMHDTAVAGNLDPDRLSFTATLRIVRRHTIARAVVSP